MNIEERYCRHDLLFGWENDHERGLEDEEEALINYIRRIPRTGHISLEDSRCIRSAALGAAKLSSQEQAAARLQGY